MRNSQGEAMFWEEQRHYYKIMEADRDSLREELTKLKAAILALDPWLSVYNKAINKKNCIGCGAVDGILEHNPDCPVVRLREVLNE